MTQEEILQYNKRCADFMGLKISIKLEDGYSCGTWYKPTDNENEYLPCPVMYHSDWNWIMEVVEAIENKLNDSFNVDIVNKNQCEIVLMDRNLFVVQGLIPLITIKKKQ